METRICPQVRALHICFGPIRTVGLFLDFSDLQALRGRGKWSYTVAISMMTGCVGLGGLWIGLGGQTLLDADWQVVLAHNDLSSFCHFNRQPGRNSATETETALKNLTPRYKQKRCVSKSCFREVLTESPPDKKWPRTTQKYGRSDHRLSQKRDEIT